MSALTLWNKFHLVHTLQNLAADSLGKSLIQEQRLLWLCPSRALCPREIQHHNPASAALLSPIFGLQ